MMVQCNYMAIVMHELVNKGAVPDSYIQVSHCLSLLHVLRR